MVTMTASDAAKTLGKTGENLALCTYVDAGLKPVASNFRAGNKAEIDLVVFDEREDVLVFCEVKTRKDGIDRGIAGSASFRASDSVNPKKRMKNIYAAKVFISKYPEFSEKNVRFDVAEVYNINGAYEVSIIKDAF